MGAAAPPPSFSVFAGLSSAAQDGNQQIVSRQTTTSTEQSRTSVHSDPFGPLPVVQDSRAPSPPLALSPVSRDDAPKMKAPPPKPKPVNSGMYQGQPADLPARPPVPPSSMAPKAP